MFVKMSPPPKPTVVEWTETYPCERVPEGLLPEATEQHRSADGQLTIECHVFRWKIIISSWIASSQEWEMSVATCEVTKRVDNGGEVHSGISGMWNQQLERRLWRQWGPFRWVMLSPPVAIQRNRGGPPVVATTTRPR